MHILPNSPVLVVLVKTWSEICIQSLPYTADQFLQSAPILVDVIYIESLVHHGMLNGDSNSWLDAECFIGGP
jgi:hypothetical protein